MDANSSTERLFFALWPRAETQRRFHAAAESVLTPRSGGRRPATENLHITLAFLGPVDAPTRAQIERAAEAVAVAAFDLALDRIGCFRRRRLLWLGASQTPEPLGRLVETLRAAQTACGLTPDDRPYHAHVTLARNLRRCPPAAAIEPIVWPVRDFVLVRSDSRAGGARYEIVRRWALG